ncbi:MAG: tetratricopeptide repeat protein [Thermodesulfobacteriota bacterium]
MLYEGKEVSRLLGVSESQIRYWDATGLIPGAEKKGASVFFDSRALIALRAARELRERGVSLCRIKKSLEALASTCPDVESLMKATISLQGSRVVITCDGPDFTPGGRFVVDLSGDPVPSPPLASDDREALFFRAIELEEQGRLDVALRLYLEVLALDPCNADALVNVGNIEYVLECPEKAEHCYREALLADPDHIEANYNLAAILSEQGDLVNAVIFYRKALHEDEDFANAHFNIARAFEELGLRNKALDHWGRYLQLDPDGRWADFVRNLLEGRE